MKTIATIILSFSLCVTYAQQKDDDQRPADATNAGRGNDPGFRDDSTDATMGVSPLSGTPGTATPIGEGGLGTNETPGKNTSSDIYNIERRDSIRNAEKEKSRPSKQKRPQRRSP